MLHRFCGLPSSEGSGFSHCWRQRYQTWWTKRLIQYGNSSASCVFQTGFCVHMPKRWFFACSVRPYFVERGRIKHTEFVSECSCVSRKRQKSNSWLLLFAFSTLDLPSVGFSSFDTHFNVSMLYFQPFNFSNLCSGWRKEIEDKYLCFEWLFPSLNFRSRKNPTNIFPVFKPDT